MLKAIFYPSFVTLGLTFVKPFLESLLPLGLVNCQSFSERANLSTTVELTVNRHTASQ